MAAETPRLETTGVFSVHSLEKSDWTSQINNILPSTITKNNSGSTGLLPVLFSRRKQRGAGAGRSFLHLHVELFLLRGQSCPL